MPVYSTDEVKKRIAGFPRKNLIQLPTPLHRLENLSSWLGGPEIFIKRDDLTGLAFGGNKSRKLEFIISDVLEKGADVLITWASLQSNWCLQAAAAARKFSIKPILILFQTYDIPQDYDGNLLLDFILGADIRIRQAEKGKIFKSEDALEMMDIVANEVRKWGHTPYIAPVGGSMPGGSMDIPLGAVSYVQAFLELAEQAEKEDLDFDCLVHATGSGGTQAGLVVGTQALGKKTKIIGISVSEEKEVFAHDVYEIAGKTAKALDLELDLRKDDIIVYDEYIKDGYGTIDSGVAEVIRLLFTREGIILDPVYTAKAMEALIDLSRKGVFKKNHKIVFIHTGGTPALFPFREKLVHFLSRNFKDDWSCP